MILNKMTCTFFHVIETVWGVLSCFDGWRDVLSVHCGCISDMFHTRSPSDHFFVRNFWPRESWYAARAVRPGEEVLDAISKVIHIQVRLGLLSRTSDNAGLFHPSSTEFVYIKPYGVNHPIDLVLTLLHECSHLLVDRFGHDCQDDDHCKAWLVCNQMLTALFQVRKLNYMVKLRCYLDVNLVYKYIISGSIESVWV